MERFNYIEEFTRIIEETLYIFEVNDDIIFTSGDYKERFVRKWYVIYE
ncbi:MAG: hypothetical protein N4A76_12610 [Firmicutes bacterium]|jgi:hypothetical protein|nr:hypothetical protein [Bacillota bacterium]